MKRVVIVNNLMPPLARGGAEQAVIKQVSGFASLGFDVTIISSKSAGMKVEDDGDWHIERVNSAYYNLIKWPKALRLLWHFFHLINVGQANQVLSRLTKTGDILVSNNLMGLGFGLGVKAKSRQLTWVHILHDIQLLHPSGLMNYGQEELLNAGASRLYQRIVKQQFGEPDLVISPSAWLLELHQEKGFFKKSQAMVCANPSVVISKALRRARTGFNFGYLGQIEEHKGVMLLVEAFKSLPSKYLKNKDVNLKIAGEGSLSEELLKQCHNVNIDYLGSLSRAEVKKFLQSIDCLVVPSLCYENAPTVIVEAFSYGVSVIASDLGGIREMISNSEYRFKPELKVLTEKLSWALDNADKLEVAELGETLSAEEYCKKIVGKLEK